MYSSSYNYSGLLFNIAKSARPYNCQFVNIYIIFTNVYPIYYTGKTNLIVFYSISFYSGLFHLKGYGLGSNSNKELPCAVCVFVYALKPESCYLAFQFEELRCSSNQISCACLESAQFSVFDSFIINITSPSYYIQCRELCHIIHLIVNNM